jgi:hypothetical protein
MIAPPEHEGAPITVRNMSPQIVVLDDADPAIVLAPLGELVVADPAVQAIAGSAAARPYLETYEGRSGVDDVAATVFGIAFWVALVGAFVVALQSDGLLLPLGFVVLCIAVALLVWHVKASSSWGDVVRWARDKAALVAVLVVGFGIPAVVLLVATRLFDELRDDPSTALDAPFNRIVTYRLLQLLFLGIATTFPALLYFLFDRQNTETLRTRFLLALFRLDPRIRTADDWEARYGRQVAEAFGKPRVHGASRVPRTHRSPVIVATVVLSIGWLLAFLNLDAVSVDGTGEILTGGSLLRLYEPERGVVAFGFLGAYFFGVNTVLRSYLRGDLRPKAYSQITTRVLIVVVLSSLVAITAWGDDAAMLAVAFFAGVVPDTVLQWVWERFRGARGSRVRFDDVQPLTRLEGIDLYDRARLAEEGVTNVEALAHADLVDLVLQTRIPPARLVDWVDQAILHLHTNETDGPLSRRALRAVGVRTATDLLAADAGQLAIALGVEGDASTAAILTVIVAATTDDEWVRQLQSWRRDDEPATTTITSQPMAVDAAVPRSPSVAATVVDLVRPGSAAAPAEQARSAQP